MSTIVNIVFNVISQLGFSKEVAVSADNGSGAQKSTFWIFDVMICIHAEVSGQLCFQLSAPTWYPPIPFPNRRGSKDQWKNTVLSPFPWWSWSEMTEMKVPCQDYSPTSLGALYYGCSDRTFALDQFWLGSQPSTQFFLSQVFAQSLGLISMSSNSPRGPTYIPGKPALLPTAECLHWSACILASSTQASVLRKAGPGYEGRLPKTLPRAYCPWEGSQQQSWQERMILPWHGLYFPPQVIWQDDAVLPVLSPMEARDLWQYFILEPEEN